MHNDFKVHNYTILIKRANRKCNVSVLVCKVNIIQISVYFNCCTDQPLLRALTQNMQKAQQQGPFRPGELN